MLAIAALAFVATGAGNPPAASAGGCDYFSCPDANSATDTSAGPLRKSEAARIADWYIANHVEWDGTQVNGIDCTGFVSRVWALGRVIASTSTNATIPYVQTRYPSSTTTLTARDVLTGKIVKKGDYTNVLYLAAFWNGTHAGLIEAIDADGTVHTLESRTRANATWDALNRYWVGGPGRSTRHVSELGGYSLVVRKNWIPESDYLLKQPMALPTLHLPVYDSTGVRLQYRDRPPSTHGLVAGTRNAVMLVWKSLPHLRFWQDTLRTVEWTTGSFNQVFNTPCQPVFRYWVNGVPTKANLIPSNARWGVVYPAKYDATLQFRCIWASYGGVTSYGYTTAHIPANGTIYWTDDLTPSSTF